MEGCGIPSVEELIGGVPQLDVGAGPPSFEAYRGGWLPRIYSAPGRWGASLGTSAKRRDDAR